MSLRRLWFYPHCSVWLFQACSVCATAHLMCHAPIDQVEEEALVKFINLQTIVEGGPWGYFCNLQNPPLFIFEL